MRELDDIYNEIDAEADTYVELDNLQANTSDVAFWRFIKRTIAFGVMQLEKIVDQFKKNIEALLAQDIKVGTAEWYKQDISKFQLGHELKVKDNKPYYEEVDASAQIIKRVSVRNDPAGGMIVRVQKIVGGVLTKLAHYTELLPLIEYIEQIKIAGTKVLVQSFDADVITINGKCVLSKEVFADDGTLLKDGSYAVLNGLRNFFKDTGYDESIFFGSISDYINDVPGVKSFWTTAMTVNAVPVSIANGKVDLDSAFGVIVEDDVTFNIRIVYELV